MVKLSGQPVGIIEEVGRETRFTYFSKWLRTRGAQPVSLTMPLREEPYVSEGLHPFFENLLPEGWYLEIVSKKLKISKFGRLGLSMVTR
jgi:serine/threonine-protein kinase HipA